MRKVLVIDDEKATLTMFRLLLGTYGYTVYVAENGAAALEIMQNENPDIVFTDIKMPSMDGLKVLKRIKEINPKTEVIAITGYADMDLAVQALNLDATDFLNKPIQTEALDAALKRAEERLQSALPQAMQVSFRTVDEVTIMEIKGDVTSRSEQMLTDAYEAVSARGAHNILINFEENSYINGAGIAVLNQILTKSKARHQLMAISGLPAIFKQIFEKMGITRFAPIFDTKEDAQNYLAQT